MKRSVVAQAALFSLAGCAWLENLLGHSREVSRSVPCGPELIRNGSFELGPFAPKPPLESMLLHTRSTELTDWTITADVNELEWLSNNNRFVLQTDPITDPDKKFLQLSGHTHKDPFPAIAQEITLPSAGRYQLSLGLGKQIIYVLGKPVAIPVAVDVAISGGIDRRENFKTDAQVLDPNRGANWQPFTKEIDVGSSTGIQLSFAAQPGQKDINFIGLDNVSVRQILPILDCPKDG